MTRSIANKRILIVDDDQVVRNTMSEYIKNAGFKAEAVSCAEEALELARQIRFHVIMIDTRLHAMSALELYLALKEITPTSVTILFAETDEIFIKQAEEVVKRCAYTFLTKPLDLDKLFSILETIKQQLYSDLLEKPEDSQE